MIDAPLAHIGGMPIEETLGMYGPGLLLAAGAASATLTARVRRLRQRASGLGGTRVPERRGVQLAGGRDRPDRGAVE